MTKIKLGEMSASDRLQLMAELKAQQQQERESKRQERETYKELVSVTVDAVFEQLSSTSGVLREAKIKAREAMNTIISLKNELYSVKEGQFSHAFINADQTRRVKIGFNVIDDYDDTVDVGVTKVKEYINSLATNDQTRILVDTVLKLLSKDQKGTLKASRVLQLQQMADGSGNGEFVEAVKIIRDAYKPIESKLYIRCESKGENGEWVSLPLSLTDA